MEAVLFFWSLCGLLGAIAGSFRSALVVGGLLGLVLGPLGVIIAFAADNRSKCPACDKPLNNGQLNCPQCHSPLTWKAGVPKLKGRKNEVAATSPAPSHPALAQKSKPKSNKPTLYASFMGAIRQSALLLDAAARSLGGETDHNIVSIFVKSVFYLILIAVLIAQLFGSFMRVGLFDLS